MNRRVFLSLTGVTALAAASGCMGNAVGPSGSDSADGTTTETGVRTTDLTDEGMDRTAETQQPYPIRTPEPGDITLAVDRLGAWISAGAKAHKRKRRDARHGRQ